MKKVLPLALLALVIVCTACSKEESVTEKVAEKVDQINTENAEQVVREIKTPIDKARATQGLGAERGEEMERAMENMNK